MTGKNICVMIGVSFTFRINIKFLMEHKSVENILHESPDDAHPTKIIDREILKELLERFT